MSNKQKPYKPYKCSFSIYFVCIPAFFNYFSRKVVVVSSRQSNITTQPLRPRLQQLRLAVVYARLQYFIRATKLNLLLISSDNFKILSNNRHLNIQNMECQIAIYSQLSNKSTVGNKSTATPKFLFQAIVPLK